MTRVKTYARYTHTNDVTSRRIGNGWIEVDREYMMWYPSGRQNTLVLKGWAVKARYCEIVTVYER